MSKESRESKPTKEVEVRWRCEGCGEYLSDCEVELYGESHCHVVAVADENGEPEPSPCGPVVKLKPNKPHTEKVSEVGTLNADPKTPNQQG